MQSPLGNAVRRKIDIAGDFDVLDYPNGGYLAFLAARLVAEHVQHPDLLALHASFLGRPAAGPAEALIEQIDAKKSLSRATLTLSQEGENKGFYVAAFSDFERSGGLTHSFGDAAVLTRMPNVSPSPNWASLWGCRISSSASTCG